MNNIVAIVGRPNVGKSTLFNRLTETRKAIVDEVAGVTRDRHYGKSVWNGVDFSVIDTGGYVKGSDDIFEAEIRKQVKLAIDEAQVILFLVDVVDGITPMDDEVAKLLRKANKKVLLVVNKVDNIERASMTGEFYALGLGDLYIIASTSGAGTGELLDELVKHLSKDEKIEENKLPRFAIVGRPNAGKSSLVNALLGKERNIVTEIAGTTRDTINTHYTSFGHDFILIDTAGIRKKAKVKEDIEFYSVMRSIRAIEDSDVCVLMVDAAHGVEAQDLSIFHLIQTNHKGVVIAVNKWDLVENKDTMTTKKFEEEIRSKLAPFKDVPIVFISALEKQRLLKVVEVAEQVHESRSRRIPTSKLNEEFLPLIENYPPPAVKGKYVKIKYVTQLKTSFPCFAFFCNLPQYVDESYKRFLENKLRERFDFTGVPVQVFMRKK